MKPSVYVESSVISYLAARPSRDVVVAGRQAISHEWWSNDRERFDLSISALVEEEIGLGDEDAARRRQDLVAGIPSLAISDEAIELAESLLSETHRFALRRSLEEGRMTDDPIVAEIRRHRQAIAAKHANDVRRIAEALRKRERESSRELLNPGPKQRVERTGR